MSVGAEDRRRRIEITDELLSAYIDGEVTPEERAAVERAVAQDPAVAQRLRALQQTVALLRALPRVPLPRAFTLSEVDVAPARRQRRWRWWRGRPLSLYLRAASALAALLLVVLLVGDLGGRWGVATPAREEQAELTIARGMPAMPATVEPEGPQPAPPEAEATRPGPDEGPATLRPTQPIAELQAPAAMEAATVAERPSPVSAPAEEERAVIPPAALPERSVAAEREPFAETPSSLAGSAEVTAAGQPPALEQAPMPPAPTVSPAIQPEVQPPLAPMRAPPAIAPSEPSAVATPVSPTPTPAPLAMAPEAKAVREAAPESEGRGALEPAAFGLSQRGLRLLEGGLAFLVIVLGLAGWLVRRRERGEMR